MKTAIGWLKLLVAIGVLIAVGEIPWVREVSRWIDVARPWLLPLTIASTAIGFVMLACGLVLVGIGSGRPMSEAEQDWLAARTQVLGPGDAYSRAWFKGWRRGGQVEPPVEWSFAEMKRAWRGGTWWIDPGMRRKYVITIGGIVLVLSMFLLFMVLFEPPSVRILLLGTAIYALVRLGGAFWRASS